MSRTKENQAKGMPEGVCPHNEICGGCCYQGVSYEEQLKNKEG